jgi:hypothetical protein
MTLFNECMVSCYLYVLFTLTDFHVKEKNLTRDQSGWGLTIILLFTVSANVIKFLIVKGIDLRARCARRQDRANKYAE